MSVLYQSKAFFNLLFLCFRSVVFIGVTKVCVSVPVCAALHCSASKTRVRKQDVPFSGEWERVTRLIED